MGTKMPDSGLTHEEREQIWQQADVIGKWEDAKRVPYQKRLTWFYPDFGAYVPKSHVTFEQLTVAVSEIEKQKALEAERRDRKNGVHAAKRQNKPRDMER